VLDRANNTLMLHVKCSVNAVSTYVDRPPGVPGTVTYTCRPLDSGTLDNFKRAFAAAIQEHWHNKLWICPALPDPNTPPLRCGVEVSFVNNFQHANCAITLLYEPVPAPGQRNINFRSFCARGGRSNVQFEDMVAAYNLLNSGRADDFNWLSSRETEDQGFQDFTQNLAGHEFGHYLGLNHRCFSPATSNADADYCIGRTRELMDNMMSVGNTLSASHGEPWAARLRRHHYHCDYTWVGSTTPVQHHAGLINSLAGGP
jgi:hypothetical protein